MKKRSFLLPATIILAAALSGGATASQQDSEFISPAQGGNEFVIAPATDITGVSQLPYHSSHSSHASHASHASHSSHASSGY